jgi:hypothetical protein
MGIDNLNLEEMIILTLEQYSQDRNAIINSRAITMSVVGYLTSNR